uniref:EF-hand domain-containing protein n=1 Tax=Oryzias sinensis TaxID=183150 RepID=A0A8C7WV52_9TELE
DEYDMGKDGFIDLMELKLMMEKLGAPQTHLGLKNMIKEVDEDFDGKLIHWSGSSPKPCVWSVLKMLTTGHFCSGPKLV